VIQFIQWDVTPEIFEGYSTPNLYGLLFVTGLMIGYFVIRKMFRKEGIQDEILDKLVLYMVLATIIGARLGHVLFYGPYWDEFGPNGQLIHEGYFSHPLSILKIWEGGLASHGGAIAILLALLWFSRRVSKRPYLWILDRIAAPIAIAGTFIRLGNLMNSEIVGKTTNVPWGFQFIYHPGDCKTLQCFWEDIPARHPSQLYEALAYLGIFFVLIFLYWKRHAWKKQGMVFGTFLILLFGARFLLEFTKEPQVTERGEWLILLFGARFLLEFTKEPQVTERGEWLLNTGQLLSIPFVLVGFYLFWRAQKSRTSEEESEDLTKKAE